MKLVIDENIPAAAAVFGGFGELCLLPAREITSSTLRNADVLLVRSVTRVDRDLLDGSPVRFVGSCTAGVDHVDQQYLAQANIGFAHAPGANARSVVEYVFSALCRLAVDQGRVKPGMSVAIFGLGNVGGRLYKVLEACGFRCVGYDPFLVHGLGMKLASDPKQLLQADIITLHTPLTRDTAHPTYHLLGSAELASLPRNAVLINSSRGAVVDNNALVRLLPRRRDLAVVLDVWENEPSIDLALMDLVTLATPHIAGYSYDGKLLGAKLVARQLGNWLGGAQGNGDIQVAEPEGLPLAGSWSRLCQSMLGVYDIAADDRRMRTALGAPCDHGTAFEHLRRDYPIRREVRFASGDSTAVVME
jgi:erythronate-4-phosphate dehydrogenase